MRRLSRFERVGLMAVLIVACTFFYVKRAYEPQERALSKTVEKLNKVIREINSLKETPPPAVVERTLKKRRTELEKIGEELEGTAVRTGAEHEVTELLSDINTLLEEHGLDINAIVPKGKTAGTLLEWNVFEVDMQGDYYDFMRFLKELLRLPDAVKIEGLSMERDGNPSLWITFRLMI